MLSILSGPTPKEQPNRKPGQMLGVQIAENGQIVKKIAENKDISNTAELSAFLASGNKN
jgi:hypothetical protein